MGLKNFFLKYKGHPSGAQERKGMEAVFAASAVGRDDYGGLFGIKHTLPDLRSFPETRAGSIHPFS
ncbi:MAG: hypothetical protein ABSF29_11770 [Tepidisphaeraceae bacterium]